MKKAHSGIFLFWFINLSFIPFFHFLFFTFISFCISLFLSDNTVYNINDNIFLEKLSFHIIRSFSLTFYLCIIFCLIKPFIFPFLYLKSTKYQYIKKIFDKFLYDKIFMIKILIISFCLDIISALFLKNIIFIITGIFPDYIIFLILFTTLKNFNNKVYTDKNELIKNRLFILLFIIFILIILFTAFYFKYIYPELTKY